MAAHLYNKGKRLHILSHLPKISNYLLLGCTLQYTIQPPCTTFLNVDAHRNQNNQGIQFDVLTQWPKLFGIKDSSVIGKLHVFEKIFVDFDFD